MRIERAKAAFIADDVPFASELLSELESEGHLDPEITVLRMQIEMASRKKRIEHLLASARTRIDQDEIPLGLDKLRELLELDPENSEALALKASCGEKTKREAGRQMGRAGQIASLQSSIFPPLDTPSRRRLPVVREIGKLSIYWPKSMPKSLKPKGFASRRNSSTEPRRRAYENGEIDSALARLDRLFSDGALASRRGGTGARRRIREFLSERSVPEHDTFHSRIGRRATATCRRELQCALDAALNCLAKYPKQRHAAGAQDRD